MKKRSDKIVLAIIILSSLFLIGLFIYLDTIRREDLVFINYLNHYSIVNHDIWELEILSSQKSSPYLEKDNIRSVEISDTITEEIYLIELIDINLSQKKIIDNKPYYSYLLKFKLPFTSSAMMKFPNLNLKLNYSNDDEKTFKIGSLTTLNLESNKVFLINKMQAVLTSDYRNLNGTLLTLSNLEDYPVKISEITLINSVAKTNYDYLVVYHDDEFNFVLSIDQILSHQYDLYQDCLIQECEIYFHEEETKILFIPFIYDVDTLLTEVGFIIDYLINGVQYQQIIEPIKLFNPSYQIGTKMVYDEN